MNHQSMTAGTIRSISDPMIHTQDGSNTQRLSVQRFPTNAHSVQAETRIGIHTQQPQVITGAIARVQDIVDMGVADIELMNWV